MYWERYGDCAPTILFLPSWTIIRSRLWKAQLPYFGRHFRALAFDIQLEVTLACSDDTISGTIDDHSGQALAFNGWLELMSAFDTVCTRSGSPQHPDGRSSDPH